jgi:hypothetical protein
MAYHMRCLLEGAGDLARLLSDRSLKEPFTGASITSFVQPHIYGDQTGITAVRTARPTWGFCAN